MVSLQVRGLLRKKKQKQRLVLLFFSQMYITIYGNVTSEILVYNRNLCTTEMRGSLKLMLHRKSR